MKMTMGLARTRVTQPPAPPPSGGDEVTFDGDVVTMDGVPLTFTEA
jgi:hypothetical protein